MRDFFKGFKFKIIVCAFALVLGVVIYAAVSGGFSTFPENVLSTIAKPFVTVSNAVSQWVEGTLDKFANISLRTRSLKTISMNNTVR